MNLTDKQILKRLGAGISIENLCETAGCSRNDFDRWWLTSAQRRVPSLDGEVRAPVLSDVQIDRDPWGIPHIYAENDSDLFVAFGYAMAQDRLFQLDYLRRKGAGRLAEILGSEALSSDLLVRTVGLPHIARAEWTLLPELESTGCEAARHGRSRAAWSKSSDSPAPECSAAAPAPPPL